MKVVDFYPTDAVTGSCFIYRKVLARDERVLDCEVDVDGLPPYGRLVICETAVRDMVKTLGWTLLTPDLEAEHDAAIEAVSDLTIQLDELVESMVGMVNLPVVKRALEVATRLGADKAEITDWVKTLDRASR